MSWSKLAFLWSRAPPNEREKHANNNAETKVVVDNHVEMYHHQMLEDLQRARRPHLSLFLSLTQWCARLPLVWSLCHCSPDGSGDCDGRPDWSVSGVSPISILGWDSALSVDSVASVCCFRLFSILCVCLDVCSFWMECFRAWNRQKTLFWLACLPCSWFGTGFSRKG